MRTSFPQRSFTYSAPHIWNTLPHDITGNLIVTANTFKKKLETFYYTTSYTVSRDPAPAISSLNRPTHGTLKTA